MSRIGKKLIPLPSGVSVQTDGRQIEVKGPKGTLRHEVPIGLSTQVRDGVLEVVNDRGIGDRRARALHGLTRSLLANAVHGTSQGFERTLEIVGVGYRAEKSATGVTFSLGYSHPIEFALPEGIDAKVEDRPPRVTIMGIDKQVLGQTAARMRALRPPEPYKGKGVRYGGERIRTKVGKTGLK